MSQALRGVCVGAGYFSRFQYEAWQRMPEVEIVAMCNRSADKAQTIADDYAVPKVYAIEDYRKMLEDEQPDFVDIITAPSTHLELCRVAAGMGIAIICQKPLAPTHDETLQLAQVIHESGVRFMVHENWRWQPWYREIKRLLVDGVVGDPYHLTVQTRLGDGWGEDAYLARQPFFRDYPRLFIFETGVHFLDTFRFLFGEVRTIYSRIAKRNPVIAGEDSALIVCDFDSGCTAILDANRYNESEAADPRYTFGTLRLEGSAGHLELSDDGAIKIKKLGQPSKNHQYTHRKVHFAGDCVYAVQRHFVDAMLADSPFESTIDDYLKTVSLVELAYQSAEVNQVLQVP